MMNKKILILSFLLSLLSCVSLQQIQTTSLKNQRVLFLGDSITQNGLYVSLIEYALKKANPNFEYDIISIGLSSETVSCLSEADHPFPRPCLKDRIDRALKEVQPDIVIANYGMNDAIYHPLSEDRFAAYKKGMQSLIQKVREINKPLMLLTPTPFEKEMKKGELQDQQATDFSYKKPYKAYDEVLQQYGKWLYTLASPTIQIIDLHKAIQQEKKNQDAKYFTNDGIHPNEVGHLVMANAFLSGIGHPTTLTNNWVTYENDPFFQRIHKKRKDRSKRWMNYVGYTRGKTVRSLSPKTLLIVMAGQSNMVGSGKLEELEDKVLPDNINLVDFGFRSDLQKATDNFGPERSLAQNLHQAYPDQSFLFLKYAVGGASLLDWAPNYSVEKAKITENERFGNLYEQLFSKIDSLQATQPIEPLALLWMQGERDARIPEAGKDYYPNFNNLIQSLRIRIASPTLPILVGLVNPPMERYAALPIVEQAQRQIAQEDTHVYLIETADLEKLDDNLHYNSAGQIELGKRYGKQLVEIIQSEN